MGNRHSRVICCAVVVLLLGGLFAYAQTKPAAPETERNVKEAEVPQAALAALKKLADKATITEFAEEMEHGDKFYEGSWAGAGGNVDALVTETGDLVEIEETVAADMVPAAVRTAAEKEAGREAKLTFEKRTMIAYEVHYKKGEKDRELVLTPTGHKQVEPVHHHAADE